MIDPPSAAHPDSARSRQRPARTHPRPHRLRLVATVLLATLLGLLSPDPASTEERTFFYSYDRLGRLVSATDGVTQTDYVYDAGGNLLSRTVPEPGLAGGLVGGGLVLAGLARRRRGRGGPLLARRSAAPDQRTFLEARLHGTRIVARARRFVSALFRLAWPRRAARLAVALVATLLTLPAAAQLVVIDDFGAPQNILTYTETTPVTQQSTVSAPVPGGSRSLDLSGSATFDRTFVLTAEVSGGSLRLDVEAPVDPSGFGLVTGRLDFAYPGSFVLDVSDQDAISMTAQIQGDPPPIPPSVVLSLGSPGQSGGLTFVLDDPDLLQGPTTVVVPLDDLFGDPLDLTELALIDVGLSVRLPFGAPGDYTVVIDDFGFGTVAPDVPQTAARIKAMPDVVPTSPTSVVPTEPIEQDAGNLPGIANDPVVVATGEYLGLDEFDRRLGGPTGLTFARTYASFQGAAAVAAQAHGIHDSPMGAHWSHNFHALLRRESATEVTILSRKGAVLAFEKQGSDWGFQPIGYRGIPYQLVETGSKLDLMDPQTRRIHRFEFVGTPDGGVAPVESIRDRNGNVQTLAYNPDGTLASVSDDLGRNLAFTHVTSDGIPRIASITDQSGRTVSYGYTGASLTTFTDARSGVIQYAYDADQHMTSHTRPRGNVALQNTFAPGPAGQVQSQTDGEGAIHQFAYAAGTTAVTDPLGETRTYLYDGNAQVTAFLDEAGETIGYTYDADHRRLTTTDRLGDVSSTTYHAPSGYVASRTDAQGNTWTYGYTLQTQEGFDFYLLTQIDRPDASTVALGYDATGNLVSRTDGEGNVTTWTRNGRGQPLTRTNAALGTTTWTYNPDATIATVTDPSGNVTTYSYDAAKRVVSLQRPGPMSQTFTWDANDNLLTTTDENGHTTTRTYDANDNVSTVTDAEADTTTFAYDGNDDLVSITDPQAETTSFGYDGLRRITSATDARGNTTSFLYDARRRLSQIVDADGQTWTIAYDLEGVPVSFTDPEGQAWLTQSDELGRITRVEDPLGNVVLFSYDELGRLVATTDGLGQQESLDRNDNGDVTAMHLDLPGHSALYARSVLRQIEAITDLRGETWAEPTDSQGRTVSSTDPLGQTTTYGYDARNRLDLVTFAGGLGTLDPSYDEADRVVALDYSDGTSFTYTYDDDDLLVTATGVSLTRDERGQIVDSNGLAMTYDANGNLATVTYAPGKTVTYAYDARDLLATVTDWAAGVTTFGYDDDGKLLSIDHANGTRTVYDHDDADRLVSIEETADAGATVLSRIVLTLDAEGQTMQAARDLPLQAGAGPTAAGATYDAGSQVAGATYDALGRLTNDGSRSLVWNLADQIVSITEGGSPVGFTRDAFGNVLTRSEGGTTRSSVWNYALGLPSIATESEGGVPLRHHVYTPGGALLYSLEATDDARRVHHFDELGSTLFVTDGTGTVVGSYAYAPWGELLGQTGGLDNAFTWHGRWGVQRERGLYSMRARYFDPLLGRFVSRDPEQRLDARSTNPNQALFGNPLAYSDPRGTSPFIVGRSSSVPPPADRSQATPVRNLFMVGEAPALSAALVVIFGGVVAEAEDLHEAALQKAAPLKIGFSFFSSFSQGTRSGKPASTLDGPGSSASSGDWSAFRIQGGIGFGEAGLGRAPQSSGSARASSFTAGSPGCGLSTDLVSRIETDLRSGVGPSGISRPPGYMLSLILNARFDDILERHVDDGLAALRQSFTDGDSAKRSLTRNRRGQPWTGAIFDRRAADLLLEVGFSQTLETWCGTNR